MPPRWRGEVAVPPRMSQPIQSVGVTSWAHSGPGVVSPDGTYTHIFRLPTPPLESQTKEVRGAPMGVSESQPPSELKRTSSLGYIYAPPCAPTLRQWRQQEGL